MMTLRQMRSLVCVIGLFVGPGCSSQTDPKAGPPADDYPHLKMGNPSGAKDDAKDRDNFLMKKKFFALSYNDSKGTPNWVSWRVVKEDLGDAPRKEFHPDLTLPAGFHRVMPND